MFLLVELISFESLNVPHRVSNVVMSPATETADNFLFVTK